MGEKNAIKIFEKKLVRTELDAEQEKWYFSNIDIIVVLTGSARPGSTGTT